MAPVVKVEQNYAKLKNGVDSSENEWRKMEKKRDLMLEEKNIWEGKLK
jgi:hypothetical protein